MPAGSPIAPPWPSRSTGGDDLLRGRLLAVAEDVLSLSLDGARLPTYVAADAIEVVALELSGRA